MNLQEVLKKIKKHTWWSEEAPAVYQLCINWMHAFVEQSKYFHPRYLSLAIYFFKNDFVYEETSEKEKYKSYQFIFKRFKKDKKFLSRYYKDWRRSLREIVRLGNYFKNRQKELTNQEIWQIYRKMEKEATNHMSYGTAIEATDIFNEYYFPKLIKKEIKVDTQTLNQIMMILLAPLQLSFIEKQRRDFLELCLLFPLSFQKRSLKLLENKYPLLFRKLERFTKNYFWIRTNYKEGKPVTINQFYEELLKEIKHKSPKEIRKEINRLKTKIPILLKEKNKTYKQYIFPQELKNHFSLAETLGFLIDFRKEVAQQHNYYLGIILKEICRRFRLNYYEIGYYLIIEIKNLLLKNQRVPAKILNARRKFSAYVVIKKPQHHSKEIIFTRKATKVMFDAIFKTIKEKVVKGFPASAPQVKIEGKVQVILDVARKKFKAGNILVTTMTRPEFVPLLRKAKAIITDEGGLTCHAAIISRELRIPCIIGTKIATKVLKDDERVEMDLENGMITKVKS